MLRLSIGHGAQHNPKGNDMAKANSDAQWIEIDPTTLGADIGAAYAMYKDQYKVMKECRLAFETMVSDGAGLPTGKRIVFGYNFGKLSMAVVDDDRKPAKSTPAKQSLADYIANQSAGGRA